MRTALRLVISVVVLVAVTAIGVAIDFQGPLPPGLLGAIAAFAAWHYSKKLKLDKTGADG